MNDRLKILFLCTGNSCRSQMAEGWVNHLKADVIEARSAGIETHGLNPLAVKAMAEAGVDISHHQSKLARGFLSEPWDVVVTVCGHAHETCPYFPGHVKIVHVGFDDPPSLAKDEPIEEKAMVHYRRVRDEIRSFVESLPDGLKKPS
ncbi:MAG: arsenate reductase ArsC [Desulfosarcina sp.]|nr:arsenate reductase ArsC [Desulfosarcina sp.]